MASIISIPFSVFFHFTVESPDFGGTLIEGLVGSPKQINPLLAQANDVDRDLSKLVYAGLTKYDKDGNLLMDLAESYEVSNDGLTYTFKLRKNLLWHDGSPLTAEDVVFTVLTVQNSDFNSLQVINWQGVDVSKIDDKTVVFKLKNKYAQFLNNTTMGIIPKHIWESVRPVSFGLSDFNLKPVGAGPYKFKRFQRDEAGNILTYEVESYEDYHFGPPFIETVKFNFYKTEKDMITALNDGDINSAAISPQQLSAIKFRQRVLVKELHLPRYFSIFLNQNKSAILADKNVRVALNFGIDKNTIVENVLKGSGNAIVSPMIPDVINIAQPSISYEFNPETASGFLEKSGWDYPISDLSNSSADSQPLFRQKDSDDDTPAVLGFELTTSDWPELVLVAEEVRKQWEKLGFEVRLQILALPELQQVIKDRQYDALLFGEVLNLDPDPFSFWHSSQKKDPGLNLALYDNKNVDKLLEEARQTVNSEQRKDKYEELQDLLLADAPAIFIYSPDFIYIQSKKINNNQSEIISVPSDRFGLINEWYIETRRIKKQE